ncbi:uncharacterized protein (UPF0335 family) [Erwinia persicina]|jgi:uncharacterized protein (UPF0335 family)|uniref:Hemolysin XhlA n=1 Tax=Erwinia aeris TaxID=3239803 RepID=A0ABV4E522_9GAMM|nr:MULTISPECIES: hypothetical protein [Erwinia]MCP1437780.1 uncharacterized protein (UPF0335 family) [Erwinia persicina]MDN4628351.1 hypothetical protein [Erwinia sp. PsM31]
MQVKIAKLESDVDNIKNHISDIRTDLREMRYDIDKLNINLRLEMKSDFRLMFAALITSVLGLAALMAKGFYWF